jgi:hypothetical protein
MKLTTSIARRVSNLPELPYTRTSPQVAIPRPRHPHKNSLRPLQDFNTTSTILAMGKARTGFFELPALGARTLALVVGQAGAHRAREIEARKRRKEEMTINQSLDKGVRVSLDGVAVVELEEWGRI